MGHSNQKVEGTYYSFLENDKVRQHFANINIELLRGRHIQREDFYQFQVLDDYEDDFRHFFLELYQLNLIKRTMDGETYFYLDFFEDTKGKLSSVERHRELTPTQMIIGIVLLRMYYDKYFEVKKTISWENIEHEILEGEYAIHYQRIFFGEARGQFTDPEWDELKRKIKKVVMSFDKLGWLKVDSENNQELLFDLKPAIHRLAELFKSEIENFDEFAAKAKETEKK